MQLRCPHCDQQILAEDININAVLAKCRACHTVFSFHGDVPGEAAPEAVFRPRAPVPLPARLQVEELGSAFRARWRWFQWHMVFLVFFCVFWDGFLVVWYATGLATGAPIVFLVFPLLHVSVGVGLTYYVACGFLNTTTLEIAGGNLAIRHGPLPWRGNFKVPVQDVRQLYCQERAVHNKRSVHHVYDVHALLADGDDLTLVSALPDSQQALYLEQQIEARLRIKDEPVGGELPR